MIKGNQVIRAPRPAHKPLWVLSPGSLTSTPDGAGLMAELTNVLLYKSGLTPESSELRASALATGASSRVGTLLAHLLCPLG